MDHQFDEDFDFANAADSVLNGACDQLLSDDPTVFGELLESCEEIATGKKALQYLDGSSDQPRNDCKLQPEKRLELPVAAQDNCKDLNELRPLRTDNSNGSPTVFARRTGGAAPIKPTTPRNVVEIKDVDTNPHVMKYPGRILEKGKGIKADGSLRFTLQLSDFFNGLLTIYLGLMIGGEVLPVPVPLLLTEKKKNADFRGDNLPLDATSWRIVLKLQNDGRVFHQGAEVEGFRQKLDLVFDTSGQKVNVVIPRNSDPYSTEKLVCNIAENLPHLSEKELRKFGKDVPQEVELICEVSVGSQPSIIQGHTAITLKSLKRKKAEVEICVPEPDEDPKLIALLSKSIQFFAGGKEIDYTMIKNRCGIGYQIMFTDDEHRNCGELLRVEFKRDQVSVTLNGEKLGCWDLDLGGGIFGITFKTKCNVIAVKK